LIQDRFINLGVYSFLNQQNEYEVFTVNLGIIYWSAGNSRMHKKAHIFMNMKEFIQKSD